MLCAIYKSLNKADTYLYLPHQESLSELPQTLQQLFTPHTLVTTLKVTPERRFARFKGAELINHLEQDGYFLQLPPTQQDLLTEFKARSQPSKPE